MFAYLPRVKPDQTDHECFDNLRKTASEQPDVAKDCPTHQPFDLGYLPLEVASEMAVLSSLCG